MTTKAQSVQAGAMLLQKLSSDETLAGRIQFAKSYSDFLELARTEGFDLSGLSEQEAIALAQGDRAALGEISEAELAQVAGGGGFDAIDPSKFMVGAAVQAPQPWYPGPITW